jgi:hypothetical protein
MFWPDPASQPGSGRFGQISAGWPEYDQFGRRNLGWPGSVAEFQRHWQDVGEFGYQQDFGEVNCLNVKVDCVV